MSADYYNLLFIDQDNSSLSILAEKLLQHWGKDRFRAYSAGLVPASTVDPKTLEFLHSKKLDVENIRSKSVDEFTGENAPPLDFVISLSDGEGISIPNKWKATPVYASWNLHDLLPENIDKDRKSHQLRRTYSFLENRIKIFTNLKLNSFSKIALSQKLNALSNYKLNDALMDNEHFMFQFLIQRLEESRQQQKPHEILVNIAIEIQKYTLFHFFSEENYMESVSYPGLSEHSGVHARLTSDLNERLFKVKAGQISVQALCEFLKNWFLDHVVEDDAKFAEFLLQQQGNLKTPPP